MADQTEAGDQMRSRYCMKLQLPSITISCQ